jgi:hypothetical protein
VLEELSPPTHNHRIAKLSLKTRFHPIGQETALIVIHPYHIFPFLLNQRDKGCIPHRFPETLIIFSIRSRGKALRVIQVPLSFHRNLGYCFNNSVLLCLPIPSSPSALCRSIPYSKARKLSATSLLNAHPKHNMVKKTGNTKDMIEKGVAISSS